MAEEQTRPMIPGDQPIAEILEPRLLYSADALGPLAGLVADEVSSFEWSIDDYLLDNETSGSSESAALAIVDERVPDRDRLLALLAEAGVDSVVIGADQEGMAAIADVLAGYDSLDAVHLFAHGSEGGMHIGNGTLDAAALDTEKTTVERWAKAFAEDGDLLLYGCETGAGDAGRQLVDQLHGRLDVDVAASDDTTGSAALGGDWALETRAGVVAADALALGEALGDWSGTLDVLTVTRLTDALSDPNLTIEQFNAMDPTQRSLRDAVTAINNSGGVHTIALGTGDYQLTLAGADGEGGNRWGDLDVAASMTILGDAGGGTRILQTLPDRILDVDPTLGSGVVLAIADVTFVNGNEVDSGGALRLNDDATVDLARTLFSSNHATANGGAISVGIDASLNGVDVVFDGNDAGGAGGAIHSQGAVTLLRTDFLDSHATGDGGGLWNAGTATLDFTTFDRNDSTRGGGAIHVEGALVLRDTVLSFNTSARDGGAIHNHGDLAIERTTFANNTATGADGGGLYSHLDGDVTLIDVLFSANHADQARGGGADLRTADVALLRVTFESNTALEGGALNLQAFGATLDNVTFSANTATVAGALRIDSDVSIRNTTFVANRDGALGEGGAIWAVSGNVTIENSLFQDNTSARADRGAIGGTVRSFGHNLFDDVAFIDFVGGSPHPTDMVVAGPSVAALAPASGYVPTHAPLAGGPAVDRGSSAAIGTDAQGMARDEIADIGAHELDSPGEVFYWSDGLGQIWRSDGTLQNHQLVVSGLPTGADSPRDIEVDIERGRIWWLQEQGSRLVRADLDGSDRTVFALGYAAAALAINPTNGRFFLAYGGAVPSIVEYNNGGNIRGSLAGAEHGIVDPRDLALAADGQTLYWTEGGGTPGVRWAAADGSASGTVDTLSGAMDPQALLVDSSGRRLFSSDTGTGEVSLFGQYRGDAVDVPLVGATDLAFGYVSNTLLVASADTNGFTRVDESLGSTVSLSSPVPLDSPSAVAGIVTSGADPQPLPGGSGEALVANGASVTLDGTVLAATDTEWMSSAQLVYTVSAAPGKGALLINGTDIDALPLEQRYFTQAEIDDPGFTIAYRHDVLLNTGIDTFTLSISDGVNAPVTQLVTITIGSNTAPVVASMLPNPGVDEHGDVQIDARFVSITDVDTGPADLRFVLTSAPAVGHFELRDPGDASNVIIGATALSVEQLQAGWLWYVQSGTGTDTAADSFDYRVEDPAGSPVHVPAGSITIGIRNGNDAPQAVVSILSVAENGESPIDADVLFASDDDLADDASQLLYTVTNAPPGSSLRIDGVVVSGVGAVFTQEDIDLGRVDYLHGGSAPDPTSDVLSLRLDDPSGATLDVQLAIIVAERNDSPTIVAGDIALIEGGSHRLVAGSPPMGDLAFSDEETFDPASLRIELPASLADGPLRFALSVDGPAIDSFSAADLANGVFLVHDGSERLAEFDIVLTVRDDSGESASDSASTELRVTVGPDADAPVLTIAATNPGVLEQGNVVLDSRFLDVTDTDTDPDRLIIDITDAPAVGTLLRLDASGEVIERGLTRFTWAQALAGRIVYAQDVDGPDTLQDSIGLALTDLDGAAVPSQGTLVLGIVNVSDAPRIAVAPLDVQEHAQSVVGLDALSALDDDRDDTPDALRYSVVTDPSHGELLLSGQVLSAGDTMSQADVNAGRVSYRHDGSETTLDRVVFSLADSDGLIVPVTLDILVASVNDAPVAGPLLASPVLDASDTGNRWTLPDDYFTDVDSDVISYSATLADERPLPDWLTFDAASRTFELRDPGAASASLDVLIVAQDGQGGRTGVSLRLLLDLPEPEPAAAEPEPQAFTPLSIEIADTDVSIKAPDEGGSESNESSAADEPAPATSDESAGSVAIVSTVESSGLGVDLAALLARHDRDHEPGVTDEPDLLVYGSVERLNTSRAPVLESFDFADLFGSSDIADVREDALLGEALDRERTALEEQTAFAQTVVGGSIGLSSGLSVGYLIWLIRGGTLMGSVLSSLPAWRFVDPLPVLASLESGRDEQDGESLQSMLEQTRTREAESARSDHDTDKTET